MGIRKRRLQTPVKGRDVQGKMKENEEEEQERGIGDMKKR